MIMSPRKSPAARCFTQELEMDAFRAIARAADVGREQGREAAMSRVRRVGLPLVVVALALALGLGFAAGVSAGRTSAKAGSASPDEK